MLWVNASTSSVARNGDATHERKALFRHCCLATGDFVGGPNSEALVMKDAKRGIYKRVVIEVNLVKGCVLYGDTKDGPWYFELMNEARDIGSMREHLLFGAAFADSAA